MAVAHVQDAVSNGCRLRIVGDHQHRLLELLVAAAQHGKHRVGIGSVEVAGGLIGKNNGRAGDERARDRNPLLLAAGEFRRTMIETAGDAEHLGQVLHKLLVLRQVAAGDVARNFDIAACRQGGQQIELLEHEANFRLAQHGTPRIRQLGKVDAINQHASRGGAGKPAKDVEERRFSAARGSDDADELARRHNE